MTKYRKNSFVIDLSVLPARPKLDTVGDLVFKQMSLNISEVKNLQTLFTKAQVIIETVSETRAEEIVDVHNLKHSLDHDGKKYQIPIFTYENTKEVRIQDLSP